MFWSGAYEERLKRFERAAAKGHEESIWVVSVLKDVEMETSAWKEAFAKTEEPLGWYFAGYLSDGREAFDFDKKSAEGGCSWGQVTYGAYFRRGYCGFVEKDPKVQMEWLEKALNQNNPEAMHLLGCLLRKEGDDKQQAVLYCRAGAELGWKNSMGILADMSRDGEGCVKDLRQAVIWGAKRGDDVFWDVLEDAKQALESGSMEKLDCDFNQLCYSLGWGLYWYMYDSKSWKVQGDENKAFGNRCLDFYCSCVELQQKSIFTFLLFWNRTTGGVKGPGQMIAQMVWAGREDNLLQKFESQRRSARLKRIKK
jgi:TPR repeat protein